MAILSLLNSGISYYFTKISLLDLRKAMLLHGTPIPNSLVYLERAVIAQYVGYYIPVGLSCLFNAFAVDLFTIFKTSEFVLVAKLVMQTVQLCACAFSSIYLIHKAFPDRGFDVLKKESKPVEQVALAGLSFYQSQAEQKSYVEGLSFFGSKPDLASLALGLNVHDPADDVLADFIDEGLLAQQGQGAPNNDLIDKVDLPEKGQGPPDGDVIDHIIIMENAQGPPDAQLIGEVIIAEKDQGVVADVESIDEAIIAEKDQGPPDVELIEKVIIMENVHGPPPDVDLVEDGQFVQDRRPAEDSI